MVPSGIVEEAIFMTDRGTLDAYDHDAAGFAE